MKELRFSKRCSWSILTNRNTQSYIFNDKKRIVTKCWKKLLPTWKWLVLTWLTSYCRNDFHSCCLLIRFGNKYTQISDTFEVFFLCLGSTTATSVPPTSFGIKHDSIRSTEIYLFELFFRMWLDCNSLLLVLFPMR